jgi:hypothetical protein
VLVSINMHMTTSRKYFILMILSYAEISYLSLMSILFVTLTILLYYSSYLNSLFPKLLPNLTRTYMKISSAKWDKSHPIRIVLIISLI